MSQDRDFLLSLLIDQCIGRGWGFVLILVDANMHRIRQHMREILHRLLTCVDFLQRVPHDAKVASQLRHEGGDFLRVTEDFDTLSVRVVPHAERALDAPCELPAIRHCEVVYKIRYFTVRSLFQLPRYRVEGTSSRQITAVK